MELLFSLVRDNGGPWALFAVFAAAALEYMIPPLPADTVVLAGSLLIVTGRWPFGTVYAVAVAGGFLGSVMHYAIGRALSVEGGGMKGGRWVERLTGKGSIERFFDIFRRYGVWVIAINRMFPGVRSVTFLAAGAARISPAPVLLLGLVSNMAWTMLILWVGVSVGASLEKIQETFGVYSRGLAIGAVAIVAIVTLVILWRKRRRRMLGSQALHDPNRPR